MHYHKNSMWTYSSKLTNIQELLRDEITKNVNTYVENIIEKKLNLYFGVCSKENKSQKFNSAIQTIINPSFHSLGFDMGIERKFDQLNDEFCQVFQTYYTDFTDHKNENFNKKLTHVFEKSMKEICSDMLGTVSEQLGEVLKSLHEEDESPQKLKEFENLESYFAQESRDISEEQINQVIALERQGRDASAVEIGNFISKLKEIISEKLILASNTIHERYFTQNKNSIDSSLLQMILPPNTSDQKEE